MYLSPPTSQLGKISIYFFVMPQEERITRRGRRRRQIFVEITHPPSTHPTTWWWWWEPLALPEMEAAKPTINNNSKGADLNY